MLSEEFWPLLARLHGHRCPMSIMGARLGYAAAARLGRHREKGDVTATYMNRNCAIDGVMLALGTTPGNGNLKIEAKGLNLLEAVNDESGLRFRLTLTEGALALGRRYGELRRAQAGEEEREEILVRLQIAPEEEVVEVSELPGGACCRRMDR